MANNDAKTKQVIVIRKDVGMNVGKIASQASHASVSAIFNKNTSNIRNKVEINLTQEEEEWFNDRFTKIVLVAENAQELEELLSKAEKKGLNVSKPIIDAGHTFFDGVPTLTAIAIGPNFKESIDEITGHLPQLKETNKEASMRKALQKLYKKLKKSDNYKQEAEKIKELLWGTK